MPQPPERFNRVLSPDDAYQFAWELEELWHHAPDVMARKVPEALINQAFTWFAIQRFAPMNIPILGVGVHEDPVFELLRQTRRYAVTGIDPAVVGSVSLEQLHCSWVVQNRPVTGQYSCIFACSVLEHVQYDSLFMSNLCDLLLPGGVAILTVDFHPGTGEYEGPLPQTNRRFYTQDRIMDRILPVVSCQCKPVDDPYYGDAKLDFCYEKIYYTFASLVVRKPRLSRPQESPL